MQCVSATATCRFYKTGREQRLYVFRNQMEEDDVKENALQTLILDDRKRSTWEETWYDNSDRERYDNSDL
jgi:hypothetical protein